MHYNLAMFRPDNQLFLGTTLFELWTSIYHNSGLTFLSSGISNSVLSFHALRCFSPWAVGYVYLWSSFFQIWCIIVSMTVERKWLQTWTWKKLMYNSSLVFHCSPSLFVFRCIKQVTFVFSLLILFAWFSVCAIIK